MGRGAPHFGRGAALRATSSHVARSHCPRGRDKVPSQSGDQLYIGKDVFHAGTSGMVGAGRSDSRWVMTLILAPANLVPADTDLHARYVSLIFVSSRLVRLVAVALVTTK